MSECQHLRGKHCRSHEAKHTDCACTACNRPYTTRPRVRAKHWPHRLFLKRRHWPKHIQLVCFAARWLVCQSYRNFLLTMEQIHSQSECVWVLQNRVKQKNSTEERMKDNQSNATDNILNYYWMLLVFACVRAGVSCNRLALIQLFCFTFLFSQMQNDATQKEWVYRVWTNKQCCRFSQNIA